MAPSEAPGEETAVKYMLLIYSDGQGYAAASEAGKARAKRGTALPEREGRAPEAPPRGSEGARGAEPPEFAYEASFRQESGRVLASLIASLGDFDVAEEALQEAWVAALEHWPAEGMPDRPGAWLLTVARRKAVDRARREGQRAGKQEQAALLHAPDDGRPG